MHESLSIVIPAYNEAGRITDSLSEVIRFVQSYHAKAEIIVVDDGSTDDTASLVESIVWPGKAERFEGRHSVSPQADSLVRLVRHNRNCGKGAAVRTGFRETTGDIVLFTDADLSSPISEAPRLIQPILDGQCDVAIGSRALDLSMIGVQQGLFRRNAGRWFNRMVRWMTGLELYDTQCGFKAFRRQVMVPVFARQRVDGFAFDVELLYLAARAGHRILEVPVRWDHAEGSKVSLVHHTREMAIDLCRVRWYAWRGHYDR